MAVERSILNIPKALASGDLSSNQHYCVYKNTTDNQFALCATDGMVFDGILQNKPSAANAAAEVMALGISKVVAGETLTAGDRWRVGSAGTALVAEGTITGADVGDYVAGVVLEGCAAGEKATVTIGLSTFKIETQ